jgi:hypothetical protein
MIHSLLKAIQWLYCLYIIIVRAVASADFCSLNPYKNKAATRKKYTNNEEEELLYIRL